MDLRQIRAVVTDSRALSSLEPETVCDYLGRAGWTVSDARRTGVVWTQQLDDGVATVFVPNDRSYADYPIRMTELLTTLAVVEGRSQLAILADLLDAPGASRGFLVNEAVLRLLAGSWGPAQLAAYLRRDCGWLAADADEMATLWVRLRDEEDA